MEDLLYQIAITLIPNIGDVNAKALIHHFGTAKSIFQSSRKELENIEGMGAVRVNSIIQFKDFARAEEEIKFIDKFNIRPLFITDPDYPQRLLNCFDSPVMLYYRGNADLNSSRMVTIVGTRNNSEYGRVICEKLIDELSEENIVVISGLAFGIDSIAHKTSLKNNVPTIGVLAHGLDRLYPAQNRNLATQMIGNGGIITDFRSKTLPDRQNFPSRNRIAAGLSDCIVVIESGKKGGSLITAELGNGYNKDVFAFPGKISDSKSEGCNYLIKTNKAALITSAADLLENMCWNKNKKIKVKKQKSLFIELSAEEKILTDLLKIQDQMHIDELYFKSKLNSSAVAQALLMLEMNGVIISLPGKMYQFSD